MESRFHRVTPYAAGRLRMLFVLNVSRDEVLVGGRADRKRYHIASGREARTTRLWQTKIIEKEFPFS
jgi:hypothetical protein